jgi:uncharacterized membrane protein YkvA (DUF1232 family)
MAKQNQASGGSRVTDLFSMGQQAWQLFASGQVPLSLKAIPVLAALYVLSPLDFLPDVIPLAGQLDDVAILLIGLKLFTQLAGRYGAGQTSQSVGAAVPPPSAPHVTATYRVRED